MLQRDAACCSVMQHVAVCCSVLGWALGVLQRVVTLRYRAPTSGEKRFPEFLNTVNMSAEKTSLHKYP